MGVEAQFIEIIYQQSFSLLSNQYSNKIETAPNQLNLIFFTKKQDQRYFDP